MKKLLLVCMMLAALSALAFAAGKDNTHLGATVPAPTDEYSLAKAAYERWLTSGTATAEEKALIERYNSFQPVSPAPAPSALDAVGGPDGFGYRWVDNTGGDTVAYNWIEICADPTALAGPSGDDAQLVANIGFPFPYYGVTYNTVSLSTNGTLTFGATFSNWTNLCINAPTEMHRIAVYWDDMIAQAATPGTCANGRIYYKNFGDYTVFEWHLLDPFSGTGLTSVEAILWSNGMIKIQWHDTEYTHTSTSATVGIETIGTNGLQYVCNAASIVPGRAIVFYLPPPSTNPELVVENLAPCGERGPDGAAVVSLRVRNAGGGASDPTLAQFDYDGTTFGAEVVPALPPAGFVDIAFATTINLSMGPHTLTGSVVPVPNDDPSNNVISCPITVFRTCPTMAPADVTLDPIPTIPWAGLLNGNCGNGGKWVGAFNGVAGGIYHWDVCNQTPGAGDANFDIDIKIVAVDGTILAGEDGPYGCGYHSNDYQWTCSVDGLYYVVFAPYSSYNSHNCAGNANNTFTLNYWAQVPTTCDLVCPEGGIPEGEPDCADEYLDVYNGGCNSIPPVFQPIYCGQTICGTAGTFLYTDGTGVPQQYRDTDWFELVLPERDSVRFSVTAEFPSLAAIVGSGDCIEPPVLAIGTAYACETVTVAACLPAGTYYLVAAPNAFGGVACGSEYYATVTCEPCAPTCWDYCSEGETTHCFADGGPINDVSNNLFTIYVPLQYHITDVNACWDATHTYTGDVSIILTSPEGTSVELFNRLGGGGDNWTCTSADDEAVTPFSAGAAPYTGTYIPANPLAGFDGENAMGAWTINFWDQAGGDIGYLNFFCLTFEYDYYLNVELADFAAVAEDGQVSLRWTTASETDNDHFDVVRDGSVVARVAAENNAAGASYAWVDENVTNGTTYRYTLVAVDANNARTELRTIEATPDFGAGLVTEYALYQNYPNPFNPTTSLSFDLVDAGFVTLKVYNLMGQEVANVVNGTLSAGRHTVSFDATDLPSGAYLYRIEANGFSAVKKMMLMK